MFPYSRSVAVNGKCNIFSCFFHSVVANNGLAIDDDAEDGGTKVVYESQAISLAFM